MSYDERKLCVVCAWRGTCQLKYSMPGGVALHCIEFTRDVTLKEPEEEIRKRNIVLLGARQIGKTTVVRTVVDSAGLSTEGYYTRTVKEGFFGGRRHEAVLLSGRSVTVAKTKAQRGWTRLGYVYVNVEGIERDLVPRLEQAIQSERTELIVLDEVSRWQCLSSLFRERVVDCITSRKSVVVTMSTGDEDDTFLRSLESRSDVTVIHMGYADRAALPGRLLFMLTGQRQPLAGKANGQQNI